MINVWATFVPHNGSAMDQRSFSLWAPNGRCLVTNEEKTSLKAACLQAATTFSWQKKSSEPRTCWLSIATVRARTLDFVRFFAPRPHPQRRDWSSSTTTRLAWQPEEVAAEMEGR